MFSCRKTEITDRLSSWVKLLLLMCMKADICSLCVNDETCNVVNSYWNVQYVGYACYAL